MAKKPFSNPALFKKISETWNIRALMPYQWRIENKLDLYPKSQRVFFLETKTWGNYSEVHSFLRQYFSKKTYKISDKKNKTKKGGLGKYRRCMVLEDNERVRHIQVFERLKKKKSKHYLKEFKR